MDDRTSDDQTSHVADRLASKLDAFAAELEADEQALLAELVGGDEVAGFATGAWPGLRLLAPDKLHPIVAEGGGSDILRFDPTAGHRIVCSGGGNDI